MSGLEIPLLVAGATAAVAGAGISAAGAIQQGKQAEAIGEFNARAAERDAALARQAAGFEEARARERSRSLLASQRAALGASGRTVSEGSSLLLQAQTVEDAELDALAIRYSGSVQEARERGRASAERFQGRAARFNSRGRAFASLLGGVTSAAGLLGSANFSAGGT